MKTVFIHRKSDVEKLLPKLKKQDRIAQKELYDTYAPKMLNVCRNYIADVHYAEDVMIKAFFKVFKSIDSYKSQGSFEGWLRRIMVNESLTFLRLNKGLIYLEEDKVAQEPAEYEEDMTGIDAQELLDALPESYRAVFNLYVLEDCSHKEIAELLNITETTSKTQLFRAKNKLKEIILTKKSIQNEN